MRSLSDEATAVIHKDSTSFPVRPNLVDYEKARAGFTWDEARSALDGLPGGVAEHRPRGRRPARRGSAARSGRAALLRRDGAPDVTYAELRGGDEPLRQRPRASSASSRASGSSALLGRMPELYAAVLGTLKQRRVVLPALLRLRARAGAPATRAAATRGCSSPPPALYRRKIAPVRDGAARPASRPARRTGGDARGTAALETSMRALASAGPLRDPADLDRGPGAAALHQRHDGTPEGRGARARGGRRPPRHRRARARPARRRRLLVHGRPGLGHRHVLRHHRPAHPRASPASSTRATSTPSAGTASSSDERVSVWYTAPTAIRMLMRAGTELAREHDLSALRFVASVGEPLNPEAVRLGRRRRSGCRSTTTGGRPRPAGS